MNESHQDQPAGEDEYNENDDEDYNPDQIAADEQLSSSDDDEQPTKQNRQKRKQVAVEELDSGDEATIKERKRKRRKAVEGDESGGEGGLIKTRSQRLAEKIERKELRRIAGGEVTVDVDALWAGLHDLPVGRPSVVAIVEGGHSSSTNGSGNTERTLAESTQDEFIKIKRRIEFAGQITEIEEEVARTSREAQNYLAEHPEPQDGSHINQADGDGLQRPLRRSSMFEPNPLAIVKGVPSDKLRHRTPTRMDVLMAEKRAEEDMRKKAQKMSTMQKSALDWKGFVVEQGFGEELTEYGKSKKGFLAREEFLDKVHGVTQEAKKAAKLKA